MWPPIVRKCTFYCVDSANSTFHERVDGRCRKGSLLYTRETNSPLSFCPPPSELATGAGGHPPRWRCKKGEPFSHGGSKKEIAKTLKGEGERRGWLMHFSEATLLHHHRRRRRRRSCNKGSADCRSPSPAPFANRAAESPAKSCDFFRAELLYTYTAQLASKSAVF